MSAGMKRTIDELFIDAAPAAAPPAQAALTAQAVLAVSPPPSLRVLIKDPVAASPGSETDQETEEEELVDGKYTINGIRATPPRLLLLHAHAADSGGGVPDKFALLSEVVWQSLPPRERGGSQVASPCFDKSTSDSNASSIQPMNMFVCSFMFVHVQFTGIGCPASRVHEHIIKFNVHENACSFIHSRVLLVNSKR